MRKLVICAIALAMVGCKSEFDRSEVSVSQDSNGRMIHTVDGDPITGTVVSKEKDGLLRSSISVKGGVLDGQSIEYRKGKPYAISNFSNGNIMGQYEQFCADGKHEIKRSIVSWPDTYSEETFSCKTGNQLIKKNLADRKPVGEQIQWVEADGQQIMLSKANFNEQGEHQGESLWFHKNTGTLIKQANYENGVLDGEYAEYNDSGGTLFKGTYKAGQKVGKWVVRDSWKMASLDLMNSEDVKGQVLSSLGITYYDLLPFDQISNSSNNPNQTDLKKAEFYFNQGKIDFKKPYSFNSRLENLTSRHDEQPLHRYIPVTNVVHETTLEWVLEHGGDVNVTDYQGSNRLMACLDNMGEGYGCSLEHIEKLVELTDFSTKDFYGRTALHRACKNGRKSKNTLSVREAVLAKGEVNAQDDYGWTPLHYCFSNGLTDEARDLIARGADVTLQSKDGVAASQMIWLATEPEPHATVHAEWGQDREKLAMELHKAGKLSYHTKLPAFEVSIRDLAMQNGNLALIKHIDLVEPR